MTSYIELLGLIVLLMLPFLYETSHIFRYYFKFLIYYVIVSFNSVILIPAFLFRPCDVRNLLWASTFCHRITTIIGLRWELRGREHLEKEQACIIVANHQSSLDVLGMFNIWHVMNKCTVVAKRELFYAWPFGLAAWLAGLIFIDRVRGDRAHETLNTANKKIKQEKIKLWFFPEGTRRNTGEMHPFKKGAFHMAISEQMPILPVVFSSYCTFLNDKKKIFNAGRIIITTLPPILTTGLTKEDMPELMEIVQRQMSETYKQTSAEILQRYKTTKASGKLRQKGCSMLDSNDVQLTSGSPKSSTNSGHTISNASTPLVVQSLQNPTGSSTAMQTVLVTAMMTTSNDYKSSVSKREAVTL